MRLGIGQRNVLRIGLRILPLQAVHDVQGRSLRLLYDNDAVLPGELRGLRRKAMGEGRLCNGKYYGKHA